MILSPDRKEIIQIFMSEAKRKHDIRSGTKPVFNEAIGLVEVCVAFEAFINELLYHKSISKKRKNFSKIYQNKFESHLLALKNWINELKKELDNYPLDDMTPNSTNNPININNPNSLEEIIEVVYRVRSNLVHGSKSVNGQRNEILIGNSFHFLYTFLEIIFTEEKII